MTTYVNYDYLPELNYWFTTYWKNNSNIPLYNYIKLPTITTDISVINRNSFLEVLFNNDFDSSGRDIVYTFKMLDPTFLTKEEYRRLKYTDRIIRPFITDSTGVFDLFNLTDTSSVERNLIEQLKNYREGQSVDISGYNYEDLPSTFSQLLYNYLNIHSNNMLININVWPVVDESNTLIEKLFNVYMNSEIYNNYLKMYPKSIEEDLEVPLDAEIIRYLNDIIPQTNQANKIFMYINMMINLNKKWE